MPPLAKIPPQSVAIRIGRNIASGRPLTLRMTQTDAATKTYALKLEFDFIADILTTDKEVDPLGINYACFGDNPGNILNGGIIDVYFTDKSEAIILGMNDFSTNGEKVRSGGGISPHLLAMLESLNTDEIKSLRAHLSLGQ